MSMCALAGAHTCMYRFTHMNIHTFKDTDELCKVVCIAINDYTFKYYRIKVYLTLHLLMR